MTNIEIVKKLIGEIRPIGKSEVDAERFKNLKAMCQLMDEIHTEIDSLAYDFKDRKEASIAMCRDYANKYLDKLLNN